jgi:hypothetical protein
MGAIAEAMASYARPLLDATDGTVEDMNKALQLSQLCWNLALLPEEALDRSIAEMQPDLKMDDAGFEEFRRGIIMPMIRRHREMFPGLHQRRSGQRSMGPLGGFMSLDMGPHHQEEDEEDEGYMPEAQPTRTTRTEKYPGTDRYAPCPCNSGRKYKFCCGKKG